MSLSKRTRFEVFKRDKFTCQYCGKKAPDVVLHCDHVEPKSKGGSDEMLNLLTACDACNGGKGAVRLSDETAVTKQRDQLDRLQERQEQLSMMIEWQKKLSNLDEDTVQQIADYWCNLTDWFDINDDGKRDTKKWVRKFGEAAVLEAMRLASETYFKYEGESSTPTSVSTNTGFSKIGGICRVREQSKEKPYLSDMFYIRAILRNRNNDGSISYLDHNRVMELLEAALSNGADADELKHLAKRVSTWTQWKNAMLDILSALGAEES